MKNNVHNMHKAHIHNDRNRNQNKIGDYNRMHASMLNFEVINEHETEEVHGHARGHASYTYRNDHFRVPSGTAGNHTMQSMHSTEKDRNDVLLTLEGNTS